MDLDKFEPGRAFRTLRNEIDTLFERFVERPIGAVTRQVVPVLDVAETDVQIVVRADIPGIDQADIDISVADDVLTIRGEKKQACEEAGKTFHVAERSYGTFSRSVRLPAGVNVDNVQASYKKGVLEIILPKKEESKSKKVQIKTDE